MSFIFDKQDKLAQDTQPTVTQELGSFSENVRAAYNYQRTNELTSSEGVVLQEQWQPIIDEIASRTGKRFNNPAISLQPGVFSASPVQNGSVNKYNYRSNNILQFIQETPGLEDMRDITHEQLQKNALEQARAAREEFNELTSRSPGALNVLGRFAGLMGGEITDPAVYELLPFGFAAKTLWGRLFYGAVEGAGIEAIKQPSVKEWYESLGFDYSWEDYRRNVLIGGVAGAAFNAGLPIVGKAAVRGVKLTTEQMQRGYNAIKNSGVWKPKGSDDAAELLARNLEEVAAENPFPPGDRGELRHEVNVQESFTAIENGELPNIPDLPSDDALRPMVTDIDPATLERYQTNAAVQVFDPNDIEVDAKLFQFKDGGDEFGVTERLRGVKTWDPIKSGTVVIYEFADGRKFIADGHQRLGLAKRIKNEDPSQDVKLVGYVLKESDGVSPEMARVIAAVKNISEGTGTAIDAAKVLRDSPDSILDLPPQSALVRQAQAIVNLGDEAYGAIINGVIKPQFGAVVGRVIPDNPQLQQAAISVLAKTDPANEFQAEAIVRQVRDAGAQDVTQTTLFGDEVVAESFYLERAKVLDQASKIIRKDRAAFNTLLKNQDRLEAEGNQLVRDANERRVTDDSQTLAQLQALANRKGPISDALTAAAKLARETGSYSQAVGGFVDALRRGIDGGDLERTAFSDVGRRIDDAPENRPSPNEQEPNLDDFDDPSGVGTQRQADQLEQDMFAEGADLSQPKTMPTLTTGETTYILSNMKAAQPFKTMDELYELAPEAQSWIAGVGATIQRERGVTFKNPDIKDRATAEDKMVRKKYKSVNQLSDISRAGFIVKTAEAADAVVDDLAKIADIVDEGWVATRDGYVDRAVIVRAPNGVLVEVQIWTPHLYAAKTKAAEFTEIKSAKYKDLSGHGLYKIARDLPKDAIETLDEVRTEMRNLYSAALKLEEKSIQDLVGISNAPKVRSNISLSKLSEATSRPELAMSSASTGSQLPPGSRMATAVGGESSYNMPGRPSQLQKKTDITKPPKGDIGDTATDSKASELDDILSRQENIDGYGDSEVFPVGQRIDDNGEIVPVTASLADIKREIEQDQTMLDRLKDCIL